MLEHNKNLSSIVGTIQDEGPPTGASESLSAGTADVDNAAGPVEVETFTPAGADRWRSPWRPFFYILFAALVLAAALIFIAGGREGNQADVAYETGSQLQKPYLPPENAVSEPAGSTDPAASDELVVPAIVAEQNANFSNDEIHARQSLIMKQLDELTASIVDIKANNDQRRVDNQGELKTLREDLQHEIDKVAAAVAGLQRGSNAGEESSTRKAADSSDLNVAALKSGGVPVTGGWVVNVFSSEHIEPVEKLMNSLHKREIPAEIQQVTIGGKVRYRLRIPGFSSSDEGREYARNLDSDLGLKDPWVSRR